MQAFPMYYLLKTMNKQDAKSFETLKKKKENSNTDDELMKFLPQRFCLCLLDVLRYSIHRTRHCDIERIEGTLAKWLAIIIIIIITRSELLKLEKKLNKEEIWKRK
jgi:hypothetical protein